MCCGQIPLTSNTSTPTAFSAYLSSCLEQDLSHPPPQQSERLQHLFLCAVLIIPLSPAKATLLYDNPMYSSHFYDKISFVQLSAIPRGVTKSGFSGFIVFTPVPFSITSSIPVRQLLPPTKIISFVS